jgi:hypothetical protein
MRKFIMDKYNLIAFAIGLIPTILLYLFPPDAAASITRLFALAYCCSVIRNPPLNLQISSVL